MTEREAYETLAICGAVDGTARDAVDVACVRRGETRRAISTLAAQHAGSLVRAGSDCATNDTIVEVAVAVVWRP